MSLRIIAITLALAACAPASTPAPTPVSPPAQPQEPPSKQPDPTQTGGGLKAAGQSCLQASECDSGICDGEGCTDDKPGVCAPKTRRCTRDLRPYCGCDNVTFQASGTCPGHRFSARAACPAN